MGLIPLKQVPFGRKFRLPGKRRTYTRKGSDAVIAVIECDENGRQTGSQQRAACWVSNSSGRLTTMEWTRMVEEV